MKITDKEREELRKQAAKNRAIDEAKKKKKSRPIGKERQKYIDRYGKGKGELLWKFNKAEDERERKEKQLEELHKAEDIENAREAHRISLLVGSMDRLGREPRKYDLFIYKKYYEGREYLHLGIICYFGDDGFYFYEVKHKKKVWHTEKVLCNLTEDGVLVIMANKLQLSRVRDTYGIVILDNLESRIPMFCSHAW